MKPNFGVFQVAFLNFRPKELPNLWRKQRRRLIHQIAKERMKYTFNSGFKFEEAKGIT
jgi:hypothetical protein